MTWAELYRELGMLYGFTIDQVNRMSLYQFRVYCGANTSRKVIMTPEEALAFRARRMARLAEGG